MKLLGNRVLVRVLKKPERTDGGLFLPEIARKQDMEGMVYEVGPGRLVKDGRRIPPMVKCGDRVLVEHWWTGQPVDVPRQLPGQEFIIVRPEEISAVLE